jgi:enediyne biosynthesis protein E5
LTAETRFELAAWTWLVRFARTPKGLLLGTFAVFIILAAVFVGIGTLLPSVIACVAVAALLDVVIIKALRDRWRFPDGAILTGLIVAMVLRPQEPLIVAIAVALIAIASKHALRTRWSNAFNPAALALIVGAIMFHTGQSWWGALPDAGILGLVAVGAAGGFMADRINKLPLILVFLGIYFWLFTADSFIGEPMAVSEIFRTPDLHAALFFAFFMLDDPPTCPIRYEDQVVFGVIVGTASFAIFKVLGVDYYLVAALLLANAWESLRRLWVHRAAKVGRAHGAQFKRPTVHAPSPGARN